MHMSVKFAVSCTAVLGAIDIDINVKKENQYGC